jgi:hypothetical protein
MRGRAPARVAGVASAARRRPGGGLLALPTLALARSITMVSTCLSTVTRRYTHQTTVIGITVGGGRLRAGSPGAVGKLGERFGRIRVPRLALIA